MNIDIIDKNNTSYISLKGDFTIASLQDFQDTVFPVLEDPNIQVIGINISGVHFIDSSGIGKFVQVVNIAKQKKIQFYLVDIQDKVFQSFKSVRLDSFFAIIDKNSFEKKYLTV